MRQVLTSVCSKCSSWIVRYGDKPKGRTEMTSTIETLKSARATFYAWRPEEYHALTVAIRALGGEVDDFCGYTRECKKCADAKFY